jgi:chemotaxis protein CheD
VETFDRDLDVPDRNRRLVGISEFAVAADGETLVAYGLGVCIGVALYDPDSGVGGLAHTMLPRKPADGPATEAKYVDAAIHGMLREMIRQGAGYGTVQGYVVGGADIFELEDLAQGMGDRNAAVARDELRKLNVPLVGEAVGGDVGRTVEFDTETGTVRFRTATEDWQPL